MTSQKASKQSIWLYDRLTLQDTVVAPDHLTVHRTLTPATFAANGTLETPAMLDISIAADYDAPVNLPGLSFNIHFAPAKFTQGSHDIEIVQRSLNSFAPHSEAISYISWPNVGSRVRTWV